jgi:hypothetical protein
MEVILACGAESLYEFRRLLIRALRIKEAILHAPSYTATSSGYRVRLPDSRAAAIHSSAFSFVGKISAGNLPPLPLKTHTLA